jgi:hypothetical protein
MKKIFNRHWFRPGCPWCNNIQPEKCWACKGN